VTRLARHHDVTVLCASGSQHRHSDYKSAVEEYLRAHGPIRGLTLVFIDQPLGARLIAAFNRMLFGGHGIGFPLLFYWALKLWHRAAYKRALELDPRNYDVIHHVTPIAFWGGGNLWKLGRPYVWGPISGAGALSMAFARWAGIRMLLFEMSRAAFNTFQGFASTSLRGSSRRAASILTVGREEAALVRRLGFAHPIGMIEIGAPAPSRAARERRYDGSSRLRLCWAGQHIDRKALPLLLHAMASSMHAERMELHVLGAGPRTEDWQALARRLGVANIVWHGQLLHATAIAAMQEADVLVHTSIREATTNVVLEAMAQGLPIVCHDIAGMSVAITDQCGIRIPLVDPTTSIAGFRQAVERLIETPLLLQRLSVGAAKRAAELTWDAKAAEIASIYERCVARLDRTSALAPAHQLVDGDR
jgi:glycosyltransferase involved in cell wall biosynthesis